MPDYEKVHQKIHLNSSHCDVGASYFIECNLI